MRIMTDKQAYSAMFYVLDQLWLLTKSHAIGSLLGDLSLLADGLPADRAMTEDWRQAVEHALSAGEAPTLEPRVMTEQQAYAAMLHFLKSPYMVTDSAEMAGLLETMSAVADCLPADPAVSGYWRRAVEYALGGGEAGKLELNK